MNHIQLYTKAYEQLNRLTPLKFDCGRLCNRACCRGQEDAGMWLFPGEDELLAGEAEFTIRSTGRRLANGRQLQMLVCPGSCRRELRPLSCRIFPLTPYLTSKDIILADIDTRAKGLCPLAKGRDALLPEFVRKVGQVCRELSRDPEIREFIGIITEEIEEFRRMARLLGRDL